MTNYELTDLPYAYSALEPQISESLLQIHHQKHHQAYVKNANDLLKRLESARTSGKDSDMKSLLKSLSFNVGGHVLHTLFWENLINVKDSQAPQGSLMTAINDEFSGFDTFRKEFTDTAMSVEGSGWAVLAYDLNTRRLLLMQVEKHNVNLVPSYPILLVLDMWEHAYYLDYKNEKAKFVEAFWDIVNWSKVEERYSKVIS